MAADALLMWRWCWWGATVLGALAARVSDEGFVVRDYLLIFVVMKSDGNMANDPRPKFDLGVRRVTVHNKKRRARCHNYDAPGTYLITIAVEGRRPLLGQLVPGENPYVSLSELGVAVLEVELPKIAAVYPMVKVWQVCIMPDHIHMILNVSEPLPKQKCLGHLIGAFKGGCSRTWWQLTGDETHPPLFEEGFNDGILFDDGQIDRWKRYIADNPRRLALKRANRDLFTVWQQVTIGQWQCQMIGNRFLLEVPDIMAVIVHRADTDEVYEAKCREWMACGEKGGVLVSAAIAPRERLVMRRAMDRGYRLIVLRENGFHQYYKPAGVSFDACAAGLMLQICPWDYHFDNHKISRSQCLELNALALCISRGR